MVTKGDEVWVSIAANDEGVNVAAFTCEKDAIDDLYDYVCQWWEQVAGEEYTVDGNRCPKKPPKDKQKAIKMYFTSHPNYERGEFKKLVVGPA